MPALSGKAWKQGIKALSPAAATGIATLPAQESEAMFIGQAGKAVFNRTAKELAQKMEAAGSTRDEIWEATGELGSPMFRGPDGEWRQEISDDPSKVTYTPENFPVLAMTPRYSGRVPDYQQHLRLGVIPGYQYRSFSIVQREKFFSCDYEISQNIDRMGYRLKGDAIHSDLDGIISEGIAYGAIQVPKDGQPIVLMKDRQTIGGYPKIGCLSALDAGLLAQRGPGSSVSFFLSDVAEAEGRRMLFNQRLKTGAPDLRTD